MRYEITPDDHGNENPLDESEWEVFSFGTRHYNFKSPDEFGLSLNSYGEVETDQVGLRRKIECDTAFVLGYYEHGLCSWFLKGCGGPGTECRWDGRQVAGILIWTGKASDLGKNEEERRKHAASTIEAYTQWCNGDIHQFTIYDENDEVVDSCCGLFGYDYAEQEAREAMKDLLVTHEGATA